PKCLPHNRHAAPAVCAYQRLLYVSRSASSRIGRVYRRKSRGATRHKEIDSIGSKLFPSNLVFSKDSKLNHHLYSAHDLIAKSSGVIVQNALMNALARRAFVINGILRSMAARRIL